MTDKQIFLHIGAPKTGSTFLQRHVFRRLPYFDVYNKCPSLIDDVLRPAVNNNPSLVDAESVRKRVAEGLAGVQEDAVVLSWEGLFGDPLTGFALSGITARLLKAIFPAARIIVCIRRQDDFVESIYKQTLHAFWPVSLKRFLLRDADGGFAPFNITRAFNAAAPTLAVPVLDWFVHINTYAELFGRENVLVLVYEEMEKDLPAFLARLGAFLGKPIPPLERSKRENVGYSRLSAHIALVLNRFVHLKRNPWGFIPHRPFYAQFLARRNRGPFWKALCGISRRMDLRWFLQNVVDRIQYSPFRPLDNETRRQILACHEASNRKLAQSYGLPLGQYGYFVDE